MNNTKHTAGQWLMNTTKKYMAEPNLSKGLAITSDKGVVIAFVNHDLVDKDVDKDVDEYVANAKLIAQASNMLEVLQKIQVAAELAIHGGSNDLYNFCQMVMLNTRPVILKATV